jgi:hypothetical protein
MDSNTALRTLSDFEIGYIVGLIVGEGSFTGDKHQPSLQLRMQHTDPEPIKYVWQIIGGNIFGPYTHGERTYTFVIVRGDDLKDSLELFYNHMPECRKRRLFLEWWAKWHSLGQLPPPYEHPPTGWFYTAQRSQRVGSTRNKKNS